MEEGNSKDHPTAYIPDLVWSSEISTHLLTQEDFMDSREKL